jgi:hypothetical protein
MAEPIIESGRGHAQAEKSWAIYNQQMADLFRERDQFAVGSAERTAVAEKILALWIAAG